MSEIVGIINATPDSFSGDGIDTAVAMKRIDEWAQAGVPVIDIGAESTRPKAELLDAKAEWERIGSLIENISRHYENTALRFSIDTRHVETTKRALDAGFDWVNDVSGFTQSAMVEAVKPYDCLLVVMHSLTVPANPRVTLSDDAVETVHDWGQKKLAALASQGIAKERVILDPGIGFGKTSEQSLDLIRHIDRFQSLGVPVMVGHSRKSFLAQFTDKAAEDRDEETLVLSHYLMQKRVDYLRVHDALRHVRHAKLLAALA